MIGAEQHQDNCPHSELILRFNCSSGSLGSQTANSIMKVGGKMKLCKNMSPVHSYQRPPQITFNNVFFSNWFISQHPALVVQMQKVSEIKFANLKLRWHSTAYALFMMISQWFLVWLTVVKINITWHDLLSVSLNTASSKSWQIQLKLVLIHSFQSFHLFLLAPLYSFFSWLQDI